jgi:hypothetical protein
MNRASRFESSLGGMTPPEQVIGNGFGAMGTRFTAGLIVKSTVGLRGATRPAVARITIIEATDSRAAIGHATVGEATIIRAPVIRTPVIETAGLGSTLTDTAVLTVAPAGRPGSISG